MVRCPADSADYAASRAACCALRSAAGQNAPRLLQRGACDVAIWALLMLVVSVMLRTASMCCQVAARKDVLEERSGAGLQANAEQQTARN